MASLGDGEQFARASAFAQCVFLSTKAGVDHPQQAESSRKVGLLVQGLFHLAARGAEGGMRLGRIALPTSEDTLSNRRGKLTPYLVDTPSRG